MKDENLEGAAKRYLYGAILYDDVGVGNPTEEDCIRCFKAGAEWQKQRMMRDACDTKITIDKDSIFPIIKYQLPLTYECKIGDKVKIIIVKENML